MTSKTDVSLRKLSSIADNLNKATDALNIQLESIESALNSMKLGIDAWILIPKGAEWESGGQDELTWVVNLGYGRHKSKWALLYSLYTEEQGWNPDCVGFLRDAPRWVRIGAVERLPFLLNMLASAAAPITEQAKKSSAAAKEIAEALAKANHE